MEVKDLIDIKNKYIEFKKKNLGTEVDILVCLSDNSLLVEFDEIIELFTKELARLNITNARVIKTDLFKDNLEGISVLFKQHNSYYENITKENISNIIESQLSKNIIIESKSLEQGELEKLNDLPFYSKQKKIVLGLNGIIDPYKIEEYIAYDGYHALSKVLTSMTSKEVIDVITNSNLKGRGGAGFKTGIKWQTAFDEISDAKYVICNADEGDPGAFMDRNILEGNPHSVIEGLIIAAYAVGASKGYVYIRAEYPLAVKIIKEAIKIAYENNILGKNILGTDFNFDLEVRLGAGAFVCGEETALINSIEGKRGVPRLKPPYPAVKGLWGKPTVINNVETLANVAKIILNGSNWYKEIGTTFSAGTKVFALGGNVYNAGLVEVPIGTTIREIIFDIGGGIPGGKKFKAAQTGGPSGGCIPDIHLDTKIDYDTLSQLGSMMGSGGFIVIDYTKCIVSIAKFYIDFSVSESCGKCTPCRIGNKRIFEYLEKICNFSATKEDLENLKYLAETVTKTSLCGLGQSAPNPVISTIKYFGSEYIDHIENNICPAGECSSSKVSIDEKLCKACGLCQKVCPKNAITGEKDQIRVVDDSKCIKCKACIKACPFKAIS